MNSKLTVKQLEQLREPLPGWAVKPHPTKKMLSVIHPMAVVDRLNDVFGVGKWKFFTEYIDCKFMQQQKRDGTMRDVFMSAVKGTLAIPECEVELEQYGGSTNDDMGDALKGGATDALTKISSYLGIGAEIYKGKGNKAPNDNAEKSERSDDPLQDDDEII